MTTAIFGDVHGNLETLDAVLADARAEGAESFACLGDVVGYGANPNEYCERLRALGCTTVLGWGCSFMFRKSTRWKLFKQTERAKDPFRRPVTLPAAQP